MELFESLAGPPAAAGTVHIVGAGPGDPAYLTLRTARLLSTCDVVAYDRLAPPEALALVPPNADRICVGRRANDPGPDRDEVDDLLRARAAAGQAVVRLKGGDPFVFGRGGEEALACAAAGIPFEVVPGVTSPVAVAGAAGIPVTHRDIAAAFTVVTGHERPGKPHAQLDPALLACAPGTLVVLMGLQRLRSLAADLIRHGRDPTTPAAVVSAGTTSRQRTVVATLATIADETEAAGIPQPAIIVVGEVVRLQADLRYREERPLHGLRVLLPRLDATASRLAPHLRHTGADVHEVRVATILSADPAALARLATDLVAGRIGVLLVSGAAAVAEFADGLSRLGHDVRALADTEVLAVGPRSPAALREHLLVRADRELASAAEAWAAIEGRRSDAAVLATADDALDRLSAEQGLRRVIAGRLRRESAAAPPVDVAVVPAARLAAPLLDLLAGRQVPLVSFGPTITARLKELGRPAVVEAATPTPEALVEALRLLPGRQPSPEATGSAST